MNDEPVKGDKPIRIKYVVRRAGCVILLAIAGIIFVLSLDPILTFCFTRDPVDLGHSRWLVFEHSLNVFNWALMILMCICILFAALLWKKWISAAGMILVIFAFIGLAIVPASFVNRAPVLLFELIAGFTLFLSQVVQKRPSFLLKLGSFYLIIMWVEIVLFYRLFFVKQTVSMLTPSVVVLVLSIFGGLFMISGIGILLRKITFWSVGTGLLSLHVLFAVVFDIVRFKTLVLTFPILLFSFMAFACLAGGRSAIVRKV